MAKATFATIAWIIALTSALPSCKMGNDEPEVSRAEGYQAFASKDLNRSHFHFDPQPSEADYANAINDSTKFELTQANDLAAKIYRAATCFQIDGFFLAGILNIESRFGTKLLNKSSGASGITQFTTVGVAEVSDQLGARGKKYANGFAIETFRRLVDECYKCRPEDESCPTKSTFAGLSVADAVMSAIKQSYSKQQKILLRDTDVALVYGAILIKTLLAYKAKTSSDKISEKAYTAVTARYNGQGGGYSTQVYAPGVVKFAKAMFKTTGQGGRLDYTPEEYTPAAPDAVPAHSEKYRITSSNGVRTYSELPRAGAANSEKLRCGIIPADYDILVSECTEEFCRIHLGLFVQDELKARKDLHISPDERCSTLWTHRAFIEKIADTDTSSVDSDLPASGQTDEGTPLSPFRQPPQRR